MPFEIQSILRNGFNLIRDEACKSGAKFEFHYEHKDGVLDDDDEFVSFTTSIKAVPFNTDEGLITPKPVMFELLYDRLEDGFTMAIGEDNEHPITYGNVMAFMYFDEITREP